MIEKGQVLRLVRYFSHCTSHKEIRDFDLKKKNTADNVGEHYGQRRPRKRLIYAPANHVGA
jgi:hypothetical protein